MDSTVVIVALIIYIAFKEFLSFLQKKSERGESFFPKKNKILEDDFENIIPDDIDIGNVNKVNIDGEEKDIKIM